MNSVEDEKYTVEDFPDWDSYEAWLHYGGPAPSNAPEGVLPSGVMVRINRGDVMVNGVRLTKADIAALSAYMPPRVAEDRTKPPQDIEVFETDEGYGHTRSKIWAWRWRVEGGQAKDREEATADAWAWVDSLTASSRMEGWWAGAADLVDAQEKAYLRGKAEGHREGLRDQQRQEAVEEGRQEGLREAAARVREHALPTPGSQCSRINEVNGLALADEIEGLLKCTTEGAP